MNRDYALNLKLWGSLLTLTALTSIIGLYAASTSLSRLTGARASAIAQSNQLASDERQKALERSQVEVEAEVTQAKIDNNINVFDSVTLSDYVCSADSPPVFDPAPFVDESRSVKVADRNQRVIGYVAFTGEFVFQPENCK